MEEDGEETYTLEQAQAHRELMESEKNLTEAKTIAIKELRMWLTSHRIEEKSIAGGEQQLTSLVERESKGFQILQKKAMDIIESL